MQDRTLDRTLDLREASGLLEALGFGVPAAKELLEEEKRKTLAGRLLPKAVPRAAPRAAPVARTPSELRPPPAPQDAVRSQAAVRPPGEEPARSRGPAAALAAPPTWHSDRRGHEEGWNLEGRPRHTEWRPRTPAGPVPRPVEEEVGLLYTPRSQLPADWRWHWAPEDVGQISLPAEDGPVQVRCSQCSRPLPRDAALSAARGRTAIGASRAAELSVCERCAGSTSLGGPRDREAGRYYDDQRARSASRSRSPRGPADKGLVVLV
jgi:hypothetical protein